MQKYTLCALLVACVVVVCNGSSCFSYTKDTVTTTPSEILTLNFGIQDSKDGASTPYEAFLERNWYTDYDLYGYVTNSWYNNFYTFWINEIIVMGVQNYSNLMDTKVPTADFVCESDHSGLWGPAYPGYTASDQDDIRSQFPNLEVYVHYSAPNQTSYLRAVVFIKNKGATKERIDLSGDWYSQDNWGTDVSPISNKGRYLTIYPFRDNDLGQYGDNPGLYLLENTQTVHIQGAKSTEDTCIFSVNMDQEMLEPACYMELDAGAETAIMFIMSVGYNKSVALKNAADIDAEPAQIFHDLNADQLSLIRNWGACQSVLAPTVQVTVTAPSQCSSGLTSDFTVTATTTRNDLTSDFTHRVVLSAGTEIVAPQPSTTLAVLNDVGAVKHQLWYKECLVKETAFTACVKPAVPVATPTTSTPVNTPTTKTADASSSSVNIAVLSIVAVATSMMNMKRSTMIIVLVCVFGLLSGSTVNAMCTSKPVGEYLNNALSWEFGRNDGGGEPKYIGGVSVGYFTDEDLYAYVDNNMLQKTHFFWINGVPLVGGKNYTNFDGDIVFVRTANFTCDSDHSALWGPVYPDYINSDFNIRGQYQNLESYVHFSAPNETSYTRSVFFIKNTGSAPERIQLMGNWYSDDYGANISPLNGGRYHTAFPWREGDKGTYASPDDYTQNVVSVHAAGPKRRDNFKTRITSIWNDFVLSPVAYAVLEPGQEMALMFIASYGYNKTVALKNAAEIDTEPAYIFHGLNADQLSLIRNWGGCQVILAPTVQVTVTAPSECSSGLTSDFTVTATTTRTDFTSGFTHRVVSSALGIEVVAPQPSSTLAVANDAGPMTHQLWYKECLVKETEFDSCSTQA